MRISDWSSDVCSSDLHRDLQLYLRQQVDGVFGTAIQLGMAFLASEPTNLGHGHPLHADIRQRLAYGIEPERFDDRNQPFHGWAPNGVRKFSIAPNQPISRWGACRSTRPIPRSALPHDSVAIPAVHRTTNALEPRHFADGQAHAQPPGEPDT